MRQRGPVEGIIPFLVVIRKGPITSPLVNRYKYLHKLRGEDSNTVPIIAIISYFDNSIQYPALVAEYKEEYEKDGMRFAVLIPSCTADLGTVEQSTGNDCFEMEGNTNTHFQSFKCVLYSTRLENSLIILVFIPRCNGTGFRNRGFVYFYEALLVKGYFILRTYLPVFALLAVS